MPPCNTQVDAKAQSTSVSSKAPVSLQLADLRKCIPEKAFEKSIVRSVWYMIFDYAIWFGACYAMMKFVETPTWDGLEFWQRAIVTVAYWNVAGFFMWCIFVVGHDCGHGTFSNFQMVNDILGHITHGSILVPYYPWQVPSYITLLILE